MQFLDPTRAIKSKIDSTTDSVTSGFEQTFGIEDKHTKKQRKKEADRKKEEQDALRRFEKLQERREKNREKADALRSKYGIGQDAKKRFSTDYRKGPEESSGSYCYDCVLF